jgi:hypothetical protein
MHQVARLHNRGSFFKYLNAASAVAVLQSGRLRWSSPTRFNDPFDVPRQLRFEFTERELQQAVLDEVSALIESDSEVPESVQGLTRQVVELFRAIPDVVTRRASAARIHEQVLREAPMPAVGLEIFQEHWDELIPTMRILCVSESWDLPNMWAHYCENGAGVVLEFAVSQQTDSPLLVAREVRYRETQPQLPSLKRWARHYVGSEPFDFKEFFTDYELVKSVDWSAEREWRVFSYARPGEQGDFSDYPFAAQDLRRVILGYASTQETVRKVTELAESRYPNATVLRARLDQGARRIVL